MVVQHNIMAINANRQLGINNAAVSKNLEKLSSGFNINRAGDDAAGLAISEKMRAQIKGLEVAQVNAQDSISMIQTAEGALTEVHSMLNRMVELATKAANGTYQDSDRVQLQKEVTALTDEITRIKDSTNFNGITLLSSNNNVTFQVGDTSTQVVGLTLTALTAPSVNIGTITGASTAITAIKDSINTVSNIRAGLGALQNRLEHTINNLGVTTENLTAAESRIRDTNMAKEMMTYTKNSVLIQAAQSMLAQANQQPQSVLQLLQ